MYLIKLSKNSMFVKMIKKNFNFSRLHKNLGDAENWWRCSIHQSIKSRDVKKLVSEHGILTLPNPQTGRALTPETETLVKKFYERVDMSRMMSGMKDFELVKNDDQTCGPRHCAVAGSNDTHNLCVCVHHGNVKLMLNEINIQHLTEDNDIMLKNHHDCLDAIVCPDSSSSKYCKFGR